MVVTFLGVLMSGVVAQASVQKFQLGPQDRVKVSLAKAQVTVIPSKDRQLVLGLGAGCPELVQEKTEGVWGFREIDLLKARAAESPVCQAQIAIPPQNLQIHVLEGGITVQKTAADLLLHVQKGKIILKEATGSATLHVQRGEVAVSDFQGRVKLDLLQAASQVKGLQGELELQALAGDHVIERPTGNLRLMQAQGSLKVLGGSGSLQVESVRASVSSQGFQGRIEGQAEEGQMTFAVAGEPDVNLKSKSGRITVSLPSGSGAQLNLSTQEGELVGPASFTIAREGSAKSLRGRMRGGASQGNVVIRSQEGTVIVK